MSNYRLPVVIEPLEEGGYLATSSVLPGLLVQADTVEEALALAPGVARALIEAMKEKGVSLPAGLQAVEAPPFRAEVLVPA